MTFLLIDFMSRRNTNHDEMITHICQVDSPVLINWAIPFPIVGVSSVIVFHFSSILNRNSFKQTA